MNEQGYGKDSELDEEIENLLNGIEQNYLQTRSNDLDKHWIKQIKSLCFNYLKLQIEQARDKWVLEQIEDLDAYDGIYDQGEDDYGRHRSKNMGNAVLIDDIRKVLGDK